MIKILIVFGTRPDAIKMAPLVLKFREHPAVFRTFVCVTGQHREMLDQVLNIFGIEPDYDLRIMKPDQDLYEIFTGIMLKIRRVYEEVKPAAVFVHGDTSTSTAAALAAFYQKIPVAHVESGLRTNNIYSPWPEEMNRQLTSRIATWHFAPTRAAMENLLKENIASERIMVTGNTVIDALRMILKRINSSDELTGLIRTGITASGYPADRLDGGRRLVLVTGHRRENFGEGFMNICRSVKELSETFPDTDFLYPVHLNPNVSQVVNQVLGNPVRPNLFLTGPLDYLPFVYLMQRSYIVLTDSGGIQEEAPDLGKPVLVMRDTTERPEALEAGTVELVGTDREKIVASVTRLLTDRNHYEDMVSRKNPYGDGMAAGRIFSFFSTLKFKE